MNTSDCSRKSVETWSEQLSHRFAVLKDCYGACCKLDVLANTEVVGGWGS